MNGAQATGAALRLGLIEGDGIGPDIVPATRRVVDEALAVVGTQAEWVSLPHPAQTLDALRFLDGWILGPHDNAADPPEHRRGPSPGDAIRKQFGLSVNIRPVRAFAGVRARSPEMDLVIVWEDSEGRSADASELIARRAFQLARQRRNHVTIVHNANALPPTTGSLLESCPAVAEEFSDVVLTHEQADSVAARLERTAADYDVIVTEDMFGDMLSDLAAELAGSRAIAASVSCSQTKAMAHAAHDAASAMAGHNRSNPAALFLSAAMLLRWLGMPDGRTEPTAAAARIERAVSATFEAGIATADLGGLASTSEFTEYVAARVHRR